jgi:AcrR family transcriptional regulator
MKIGQERKARRTSAPTSRGARTIAARIPLSRERIVTEALAQIDREGLAGFSTRKLGEALGVQAMSLYHHFPSKAHVLDAVLEHVIGQIEFLPDSAPLDERLRGVMRSYRQVALRYPGFFPHFAVHRMNMEAGIRFIDRALRLFNEACPDDPERAARLFRIAGYYLNGATLDEAMGYGRGPSAQHPAPDEWVLREHPAIAAAGRWFAPSEHEKTFELGLEMLMKELGLPGQTGARKTSAPANRTKRRKNKSRSSA